MQVFHAYVDVHIDGTCMINVVSAIHSWKHQWAYILEQDGFVMRKPINCVEHIGS